MTFYARENFQRGKWHLFYSGFRLNDGPTINLVDLYKLVETGFSLVCCLVIRGSTGGFFSSGISVVLFHTLGFSRCQNTFLSIPHL